MQAANLLVSEFDVSLHGQGIRSLPDSNDVARASMVRNSDEFVSERKAILPDVPEFEVVDYTPQVEHRLRERYKDTGLQVIVKMVTMELNPQKPVFAPGGWHVSIYTLEAVLELPLITNERRWKV